MLPPSCTFNRALPLIPKAVFRLPPFPRGVSGQLVGGYRILSIAPGGQEMNFVVYRGDYIKFSFDASMGEPLFSIPALSVEQRLPADVQQAPYF